MKVLLVNGSSHENGTTMAALSEMIKIFSAEGIDTEVIQLGGQAYRDCLQCGACAKRCPQRIPIPQVMKDYARIRLEETSS